METLIGNIMKLLDFFMGHVPSFIGLFTIVLAFLCKIPQWLKHKKEKEILLQSFNTTVKQLSSTKTELQLSAAILLRRFLNKNNGLNGKLLVDETIYVISSLLKVLPTGIYQKTLGDGLAYTCDLSLKDLQKTNMQNLYLGNKSFEITMNDTDMFMSDLSYALLNNIKGERTIFYNAILLSATIKKCNFHNANFVNADLSNASFYDVNLSEANFEGANLRNIVFKNCILKGANFTNAFNIPNEIKTNLQYKDKKFIFENDNPLEIHLQKKNRTIFFSIPSILRKEDEVIAHHYKTLLENMGFDLNLYIKDDYPKFGQFNKIRKSIMQSAGIIVFGFKQLYIHEAIYRPDTSYNDRIHSLWLSTPWNEIEAGMALMIGLPILLVQDKDINQGLFNENLSECFVGKIDAGEDFSNIMKNKDFNKWIYQVER